MNNPRSPPSEVERGFVSTIGRCGIAKKKWLTTGIIIVALSVGVWRFLPVVVWLSIPVGIVGSLVVAWALVAPSGSFDGEQQK